MIFSVPKEVFESGGVWGLFQHSPVKINFSFSGSQVPYGSPIQCDKLVDLPLDKYPDYKSWQKQNGAKMTEGENSWPDCFSKYKGQGKTLVNVTFDPNNLVNIDGTPVASIDDILDEYGMIAVDIFCGGLSSDDYSRIVPVVFSNLVGRFIEAEIYTVDSDAYCMTVGVPGDFA